MDDATPGRQAGRTGGGGHHLRRDGPPDAPKNAIKPRPREPWCLPPEADAALACAMEDVLDVYYRPHGPKRPLVCRGEASKQWVGEVVQPPPPEPGQPERFDYEDVRNGTANRVLRPEPPAGWRHVTVTGRRTAKDFAEVVRWRAENLHPTAEKVVLVMGNRNTHKLASLYEALPPDQAWRIAERVEVHYTPTHGSWRNVAEIELSALARDLLDRVGDRAAMPRHVGVWEDRRNATGVTADWPFTTPDARVKLRKLYPTGNE